MVEQPGPAAPGHRKSTINLYKSMCVQRHVHIYAKTTQNAYFVLSCFTGIAGVYPMFGLAFFVCLFGVFDLLGFFIYS